MGKFDGVLLASDFDNTILNTELPRRTGCPIPPISQPGRTGPGVFCLNSSRAERLASLSAAPSAGKPAETGWYRVFNAPEP